MTTFAESDAQFTDALSSSAGMADPPVWANVPETYSDALRAVGNDLTPRTLLPEVPVPELPGTEMPSLESLDSDRGRAGAQQGRPGPQQGRAGPQQGRPDPQRGRPDVQQGQPATSAERAAAARRMMAARRDASMQKRHGQSDARPGIARSGQTPMRLATSGHGQMPGGYVDPGTASYVDPSSMRPSIQSRQLPRVRNPGASNPSARNPGASNPRARKKSGGAWGALLLVLLFVVMSGVGRDLLDGLMQLLGQ